MPVNYAKTLLTQHHVAFQTAAGDKLDGPTLAKRVSPSVALRDHAVPRRRFGGRRSAGPVLPRDSRPASTAPGNRRLFCRRGTEVESSERDDGRLIVDDHGEVSQSSGHVNLPCLLGPLAAAAINPLPPNGEKTWQRRDALTIATSARPRRIRWRGSVRRFPGSPHSPPIRRPLCRPGRAGVARCGRAGDHLFSGRSQGRHGRDPQEPETQDQRERRREPEVRIDRHWRDGLRLEGRRAAEGHVLGDVHHAGRRPDVAGARHAPLRADHGERGAGGGVRSRIGAVAPAESAESVKARLDGFLADLRAVDKDWGKCFQALQGLSMMQPVEDRRDEVAEVLDEYLAEKNYSARSSALRAVQVWGTRRNVPALVRLVNPSEADSIRRRAIDTLGSLGDERAAAAIAGRVKDPADRASAVRALRALGPAAEDATIALLADQDPEVRDEACKVLGEIGGAKSIAALEELAGKGTIRPAAAPGRPWRSCRRNRRPAGRDLPDREESERHIPRSLS